MYTSIHVRVASQELHIAEICHKQRDGADTEEHEGRNDEADTFWVFL